MGRIPAMLPPESAPGVPNSSLAAAGATRSVRDVAITVGVAVLLLLMSRWVDQPLTRALAANVPHWVDAIFEEIGDMGDSGGYIVGGLLGYVVSLVGLRSGWASRLHALLERLARYCVLLLGTMAIGGLITLALKKVVSRARPEELFERGFHGLGIPFAGDPFDSFPSSHTLTAFAVAAVIRQISPRWGWPALGVAGLVAFSRVVNLDHYLSDVSAAAFIALMVAHYLAPHVLQDHRRWMFRAPWHWWRRPQVGTVA